MMFERDTQIGDANAARVLAIAGKYSATTPKLDKAVAVEAELQALAHSEPPALSALPADPKKIAAAMAEDADVRRRHEAVVRLSSERLPEAHAIVLAAVGELAGSLCGPLCKAFDEAVYALRQLGAPSVAADQAYALSPADNAVFHQASASVMALEAIISDRLALAAFRGEPTHAHWPSPLSALAILSPPPVDFRGDDFKERSAPIREALRGTDLAERWQRFLAFEEAGWLTLQLAGADELASRVLLANSWSAAFEGLTTADGSKSLRSAIESGQGAYRSLTKSVATASV